MNEKKHEIWFQMPIKNIIAQKDQAISVQFANVKNRLQSEFAKHSMYNSMPIVIDVYEARSTSGVKCTAPIINFCWLACIPLLYKLNSLLNM